MPAAWSCFGGLGLADAFRAVAVPEANNFDVSWITGLSGHELYRFRYPSVTQWRQMIRDKNDGSMPGEPPMRVSQVEIEPVLARAVQAEPWSTRGGASHLRISSQDADGVTVRSSRTAALRSACAAIIWSVATVAPATCAAASALGSRAKRRCSNAS